MNAAEVRAWTEYDVGGYLAEAQVNGDDDGRRWQIACTRIAMLRQALLFYAYRGNLYRDGRGKVPLQTDGGRRATEVLAMTAPAIE